MNVALYPLYQVECHIHWLSAAVGTGTSPGVADTRLMR